MKTEILNNGEPLPLNFNKLDEIIIGHGVVQCFRNGSCYATYALNMFEEDSTQTISIKDEE